MKMPIKCPICGDVLVNEYVDVAGGTMLTKKCYKRINHKILFRAYNKDHDNVDLISIPWERTDVINWYFGSKMCVLNPLKDDHYYLPFFEPDFSNYNKLIDKIKTYLMFS